MEEHIHITAIVPYRFYPPRMGGQKAIALFYRYFGELMPVNVLSTKNNEFNAPVSYEFSPLLSNSFLRYMNPFLFFKIKRIMRQKRSTHLMMEHPYYGWLGILLKKATGTKLIVRSHNIEAMRFKSTGRWWWRILWQYEMLVHRHADLSFFITQEDMDFAVLHFGLQRSKCTVITYGITGRQTPADSTRQHARDQLQKIHDIDAGERILLFNGTLDYKPNTDALDAILFKISPLLKQHASTKYRIIICGTSLPASYKELKDYEGIVYAGFVEDISLYFDGADIFINPVTGGGGIKTKLVEAIAANLSCVSTVSGAIGVGKEFTGDKLLITADGDWQGFAKNIIDINIHQQVPYNFFHHFYWGNITQKAASEIRNIL